MRANDLADELGVDGRQLRGWLREAYPRANAARGASWDLTDAQVAAARIRFAGRTARSTSTAVKPAQIDGRDWFWEGNVVASVVRYLKTEGWKIEHVSDTASKEQGDDIRATRGGRTLRVEVKGWPTEDYADKSRAGEKKRTRPTTQAPHWYSQALLHVIGDLGNHPKDLVAIALPDWPTFRRLVAKTETPLKRLGVALLVVDASGKVERRLG